MKIEINKDSGITIGDQLTQQIVFMIATGKLKPGDQLPSVRELAHRCKIHSNTVSEAYKELVGRLWIKRHHGRRMVVRAAYEPVETRDANLDDIIDVMIRAARQGEYSLTQLRNRVKERLWVAPPDRVLIVEQDSGMRRLLHEELANLLPVPIASVSLEVAQKGRKIPAGALAVSLPGGVWDLMRVLPRECPLVLVEPTPIEACVATVLRLNQPSVIGIASISRDFLLFARSLLAPALGKQHTIEERLVDEGTPAAMDGLDVVFCDSIVHRMMKPKGGIHYRLVSDATAAEILGRLKPAAS